MSYSRASLAAIVCTALLACSEQVGPDTTLVTRIDHASLTSRGLEASFTITNVGSRSEDVPACGGQVSPRFQKLQGPRWEEIGGGLCLAIYSTVPISLAGGTSLTGTSGLCCVDPGTYRLVISYQRDGSPRAISEQFTVR